VSGIRWDFWCGKVFLKLGSEAVDRSVLSRCIALFTLEQVSSGVDPRCAEVRGEIRPVAHHVVVSNIEVVLYISPFIVGKQMAEWRITRSDCLVSAKLQSAEVQVCGKKISSPCP
jgi:hypothetical protein